MIAEILPIWVPAILIGLFVIAGKVIRPDDGEAFGKFLISGVCVGILVILLFGDV